MKRSVTIIVPAYNEEKNIASAVNSVLKAMRGITEDYEILVINDGSGDKTGTFAEDMHKINKKIKVIHFVNNRGIGNALRTGIRLASKNYITGFPGDNDMAGVSLKELISSTAKADFISGYMTGGYVRGLLRQSLSRLYINVLNFLFNLKLTYYNGYFIARSDILKNLKLNSNGFEIFAEIKIKLILSGHSYLEIPFKYLGRKYGKSKSISFKNVVEICSGLIKLISDVYLFRNI